MIDLLLWCATLVGSAFLLMFGALFVGVASLWALDLWSNVLAKWRAR